MRRLQQAIVLLLLLMALKYVIKSMQKIFKIRYEVRSTKAIHMDLLKKQEKLPYEVIEQKKVQELIYRVTKEPEVMIRQGLLNVLDVINYGIQTVVITVILVVKIPVVAVLTLLFSVPILWIAVKCGNWDYDANQEATESMRKAGYFSSLITSKEYMEEREVFQYAGFADEQWKKELSHAHHYFRAATNKGIFHYKLSAVLSVVIQGLMMLFLMLSVKNQQISIGLGIGILKTENDLFTKITWELTDTLRTYQKMIRYRKDMQAFFELPEEMQSEGMLEKSMMEVQTLCFDHVSFAYPGTEKLVLDDFSFVFEKGKRYAIVGMNGAGKTTILKLLAGMYTNYTGQIRINDQPINQFKPEVLHAYFSIMFQEFARYQMSLEENIQIGDISRKESVQDYIEHVHMTNRVETLSSKERTMLGKLYENGVDLSGGEWQKIAVARCLYRNAPIYIMDEPTSAMDSIGEQTIADYLSQIDQSKLLITITHRLGIARCADCILVLKNGKVLEQGIHEHLMEEKGLYYHMYETQRSWYND